MADDVLPAALHDATLVAVDFDWASRTCTLRFAGAPTRPGPFDVTFQRVIGLSISARHPWRSSVSVLSAARTAGGVHALTVHSGDTITVAGEP